MAFHSSLTPPLSPSSERKLSYIYKTNAKKAVQITCLIAPDVGFHLILHLAKV